MRLLPDDDEREFASTLRRLLAADEIPSARWGALADAGVFGLALPEVYGGSGGRLTDLGTFAVEAGRGLCPTLAHGTIAAGLAIHALGTSAQHAAWLPRLASGTCRATTALWSPRDASVVTPTIQVDATETGWVLDGTADFVLDAGSADVVVVSGRHAAADRTLVFVVTMHVDSPVVEPLTLMGGQPAARLHFDGVGVDGANVLGVGTGITVSQLCRLANIASALLSLDLVGVGEAALQRTVDHTVMRHQFGRPIASFQAAQHLVANMHIALSAARLAARAAVSLIEEGDLCTRQTAVARMHAAAAAKLITLDAHQLHGGMGYVVDTDLHRYSERARVLSTFGGGADVAAAWLQGADS